MSPCPGYIVSSEIGTKGTLPALWVVPPPTEEAAPLEAPLDVETDVARDDEQDDDAEEDAAALAAAAAVATVAIDAFSR